MKAYITDAEWSYKDIFRFFDRQKDMISPGWKKEYEWRRYFPKGNSVTEQWMNPQHSGSSDNQNRRICHRNQLKIRPMDMFTAIFKMVLPILHPVTI